MSGDQKNKNGSPKGTKDENGTCKKENSDMPKRTKPPVVLSSQRYAKLMEHATKTEMSKAKQESEEEQKLKVALKAGNDQLVANFVGNMQITKEEKIQLMKEQLEMKNKEGEFVVS